MATYTQEQWDELNEKYENTRFYEEIYRVALGMTDHTISVVDVKNRTLNQIHNEGNWSEISVSMENAPESVIATGIIHPDDCDGYRRFYQDIYGGVPKGEFTMRVMEENRGWVWFTMFYQTIFDDAGTPLRAICFSDDITHKKTAENHYQQFRASVTADAEFVWEINLTDDIVIKEEAKLDDIFGKGGDYRSYGELSEVATSHIADALIKTQVEQIFEREALLEAYRNGRREIVVEYPLEGLSDEITWLKTTAYLMRDAQDKVIVVMCTNNITESYEKFHLLKRKAEKDHLTGVFNRATFDMKAAEILADNPDTTHGFIMIDVDNFKFFNDNYGHAYGDSVLELVAKVIKDTFRRSDIIGRIGGDEFTIFMDNAGYEESIAERAESLRVNLKKACDRPEVLAPITLSIGVAVSEGEIGLKDLYQMADKAMYDSKKSGKNKVSVYR